MNPTGSKLDLYATCRLAACLPKTQRGNIYSAEGQVFHAFFQRIADLVAGGATLAPARDAALDEAPEEFRAALALVRLESLQLDSGAIAGEVAFAYDVATGKAREIGRGLDRQYGPLTPSEYAGTIDRAALVSDGGAYVGDYKRWGYSARPCAENWQMQFAALCVARAWGARYIDAEIVRIDDDGEPWSDSARLEAFDLDLFESDLVKLHRRMATDCAAFGQGEIPEATLGDHCRHCPSLPYCPPKMALARAVLGGDSEEIQRFAREELLVTAENAPRLWSLMKQAEPLLDQIKTALKDLARVTPFQLEDGTMVGPVPWPLREVTDGTRAAAVVEELLGPEAERAAKKVTLTLDGINAGVKAWLAAHPEQKRQGVISETEDRVFDVLLKRGLARRIETVQIRAKKPKAQSTKRGEP